jgi:TP53 regulating kinase-like protein
MLVRDGKLFFIDFGLGERSFEIEKKGVDLHVLLEAFTAVGEEDLFEDVVAGYESAYDRSSEVIKRVKEITMRGRYAT